MFLVIMILEIIYFLIFICNAWQILSDLIFLIMLFNILFDKFGLYNFIGIIIFLKLMIHRKLCKRIFLSNFKTLEVSILNIKFSIKCLKYVFVIKLANILINFIILSDFIIRLRLIQFHLFTIIQ